MSTVSLSRSERNELLTIGGAFMRKYPGVERTEVADHIFTHMLENEDVYRLEAFEAIDISDYAYGVASFLVKDNW